MIPKYPFIVVVHRQTRDNRPPVQQHSYEAVDSALAAYNAFLKEHGVVKVTLVCILAEGTPRDHVRQIDVRIPR